MRRMRAGWLTRVLGPAALLVLACGTVDVATGDGGTSGTTESSGSTSTGAGTTSTTGNTWPPGLECGSPPRVGDFNGDGHLDIVTGLGDDGPPWGVCILPGLGDGTFGPAVHHEGGHPGFSSPTAADVDGDGRDDFIVGHYPKLELAVRYGTVDGLLGEPRVLSLDFEPLVGEEPSARGYIAIVTGDFDGDGATDLGVTAVVDSGLGYSTVFWNDGAGWWLEGEELTLGPNFYYAVAADFEADGRDDVLDAGGGMVYKFSWNEQRVLETSSFEAAAAQGSLHDTGDVTGDDIPDFVFLGGGALNEDGCMDAWAGLVVSDGSGGFELLNSVPYSLCNDGYVRALIAHADPDVPGSAIVAMAGPNDVLGDDLFKLVFATQMAAGDFDEDGVDEVAAWDRTTGLRIVEADG